MAVLSTQRIYAMVSSKSENTPYECPLPGPTGQPYCDASFGGVGITARPADVFLGAFDYSQHATAIEAGASAADAFALQASPNPTDGRATVRYFSGKRGSAYMTLVDVLGKSVMAYDIPSVPGANRFEVDLTGLSTGVYHLQLSNSEGHGAIKIVKQ